MEPRSAQIERRRGHAEGAQGAPQRVRSTIRDEVKCLAANERDREEMRLIREQLTELAPPRSVHISNSA